MNDKPFTLYRVAKLLNQFKNSNYKNIPLLKEVSPNHIYAINKDKTYGSTNHLYTLLFFNRTCRDNVICPPRQ